MIRHLGLRLAASTLMLGIVDIGDAAHFVMLDQPSSFAAAVATFLGDGASRG